MPSSTGYEKLWNAYRNEYFKQKIHYISIYGDSTFYQNKYKGFKDHIEEMLKRGEEDYCIFEKGDKNFNLKFKLKKIKVNYSGKGMFYNYEPKYRDKRLSITFQEDGNLPLRTYSFMDFSHTEKK